MFVLQGPDVKQVLQGACMVKGEAIACKLRWRKDCARLALIKASRWLQNGMAAQDQAGAQEPQAASPVPQTPG